MSRIDEINDELAKLPRGYLSAKIINNSEYYYLQYRAGGRIHSKYIPSEIVEGVKADLGYRSLLENELSTLIKASNHLANVSKRMQTLSGYLMMQDKLVASFENGELEYVDELFAPLYIVRTHDLRGFLSLRSIDATRTNAKLLKKTLGINSDDIVSLHCYGATLTDNYWFKAKGSRIRYKDISFNNDFYSNLALKGDAVVYAKKPLLTPELTTSGSFEKCWKLINNEWYLYKCGNREQIFSELFVSKLAKRLDINTVDYEHSNGYIRSLNFANVYNFEPMVAIAGEDDSYENVFDALNKLNKMLLKDYIKLMYLDCLVKNVDRHNENLGVLRNKNNGKIISLAPNFDNNIALLSANGVLDIEPSKDGLISMFNKFLDNNAEAKKIYRTLKFKIVDKKLIKQILDEIDIKVDEDKLAKILINRYKYLTNISLG